MKIEFPRSEIEEYLKMLLYHVRNDSVALLQATAEDTEPNVWTVNLTYKILE
jgi:hypothetical protein